MKLAKELGLNRFVCEQSPYNLLDRRIERELLPMAQTYGFAVNAWSPLAGGLLTGKYKRDTSFPQYSRYSSDPKHISRLNERLFGVVEALQPIAEEKGCPLCHLALAWCVQQPGITSPIIGPRTREQLEEARPLKNLFD